MVETPLWLLSISAFGAVMVLLGLLALAIALLTLIFPPPPTAVQLSSRPVADDTAPHLAAIHAAVARQWPGARVRQVEAHPQGDPR